VQLGSRPGLVRWARAVAEANRHPRPAKIICDLAVSLAVGGDCLADVGVLRSEPGAYGHIASDPTVSRTITALATDLPAVLAAVDAARAHARSRVWQVAGEHAPDHGADTSRPVIIDLDATLVTSHSDKESARPTYKRGYGFHPLCAFVDHGEAGSGEPLQIMLRPGNASSNTVTDHIDVTRQALKQLPSHRSGTRPGRAVLVRCDAAGNTTGSWSG
jgi:Transposase DDE domain group 1